MYVNNQRVEYEKYKRFNKIGIYTIKLIINIKITDAKFMFKNCWNIIEINMSKYNTEYITNMELFFAGCHKLKHVDLSLFDTKNVLSMECMFSGCSNLETLDLSSFDTKNVFHMEECLQIVLIWKL